MPQQLITETRQRKVSKRQRSLITESKRNATVRKWKPVLAKCREIKAPKLALMGPRHLHLQNQEITV